MGHIQANAIPEGLAPLQWMFQKDLPWKGLVLQVLIFNIYTISTLTKGDNLDVMLILLNIYKMLLLPL